LGLRLQTPFFFITETRKRDTLMVTIEQLRISDDGQKMYIDAHVNKAPYFKDMYLDEITIVTDDQLLRSCSSAVDKDYIYKRKASPAMERESEYAKVQVLSEKRLMSKVQDDGSWKITLPEGHGTTKRTMQVLLSGKFSVFGDCKARLVVTDGDYLR